MTPTPGGATDAPWLDGVELPECPMLDKDVEADVCVIGGGIAGLCTAYHLADEGRQVVVLDRERIGGKETLRTTAHLTAILDARYHHLTNVHGVETARLAAESHAAAIARYQTIVEREQIACDLLRVDAHLVAADDQSSSVLDDELEACGEVGVAVERADNTPMGRGFRSCLRFPNQAQMHAGKFVAGLISALARRGVRLYSYAPVPRLESGPPFHVETESGARVACRQVVVTTGAPVNNLVATHTVQAPYRTYALAARVPAGVLPHALLWDTDDPYHYVRLQRLPPNGRQSDLLIVGGEDHKTGQADDGDDRFARLESWMREHFPEAEEVTHRWSGQVLEPVDDLALIGRNQGTPDVYVLTAHSGNGTTYSMLGGMLIADLIAGRENPWEAIYDPRRITLNAAGTFVAENANVAAQFADYVTGGDVSGESEIAPGSGAILREGLSKIAAYRDEQGELHKRSAVCRHLGCIVHWNSTEQTWDCPCHGARYDALGHCLEGPATEDLAEAEETAAK